MDSSQQPTEPVSFISIGAPEQAAATMEPRRAIQVSTPDLFHGDRSKHRAFVAQADLYYAFNGHLFLTQMQRILWLISFFRGTAFNWIEPFFNDLMTKTTDGQLNENMKPETRRLFNTYESFRQGFDRAFGEVDPDHMAERALRQLKQTGSVTAYTAKFQQYAGRITWDDDYLRSQFYEGLKDIIKDELARAPKPPNLSELIETSILIDNRFYERRMEKKGITQESRKFPKHQRQNRYDDAGDPMELDGAERHQKPNGLSVEEKKRRRENNLCFTCGKSGHMSRDCSQKKPFAAKGKKQVRFGTKKLGSREAGSLEGSFREIGQLIIEVNLENQEVKALIDSGAMGIFMDPDFAKENGIPTEPKEHPYQLTLLGGKKVGVDGWVRRQTSVIKMIMPGGHTEQVKMDLVPLGRHAIVLGTPWIKRHNPNIDWVKDTLTFDRCRCKNE
ncbi:hypothetical protein sscle_16g107320 [Sclerotinia sclerotiorum 1980 UF-70]|uniref:CCHC-type domain-containing protein n=1 Tax=Sclerotinia sclerotiorum (strain ATCC 18683 / 1980 / Ss-1) TaxID=665079 RepID=A0A1D9PZ35_SCLS1|nr:hypothetical protein sscle_03g023330 [Sclerotinia sclerotiorum 1980 UF-70]APA15962.1 hypothetical protein sscle_16g107320 [Sclerotinia sclerotiorum 1980 UF-70]